MVAGFAMVAATARDGETGIKTCIIDCYDVVYERDFGADTLSFFSAMPCYDPTASRRR
jgi:hypothetical protein